MGCAPTADGDDGDQSFARGMAAMLVSSIEEQRKISKVTTEWQKALQESLAAYDKEFKNRLEDTEKLLENKIKTSSWKDSEFAFKIRESNDVPERNPFLLVQRASAILGKKDATSKEMLEQAEICRSAAAMVPADPVYNFYRAAFLSVGGRIASKVARKDIGASGLPMSAKDVPEGGLLARTIWSAYVKVEPIDINLTDQVLREYFLSMAYAADLKSAYQVIILTVIDRRSSPRLILLRTDVSKNPSFWYDCARVCSVVGDVRTAMICLNKAAQLGFREKEAAKFSLDLRQVRENPGTSGLFKKMFP